MIFITGGTGFIGKVLIEKLLRVFSIKRIYLLVRVKNNMSVDERIEHFFRESVKHKNIVESKCSEENNPVRNVYLNVYLELKTGRQIKEDC